MPLKPKVIEIYESKHLRSFLKKFQKNATEKSVNIFVQDLRDISGTNL